MFMVLYSNYISADNIVNNNVLAVLTRDKNNFEGRKWILSEALEMLESTERGYDFICNSGKIESSADFDRYSWICKALGRECYTPEFKESLERCKATLKKTLDSEDCAISEIPREELRYTREFFRRFSGELRSQWRYEIDQELEDDD